MIHAADSVNTVSQSLLTKKGFWGDQPVITCVADSECQMREISPHPHNFILHHFQLASSPDHMFLLLVLAAHVVKFHLILNTFILKVICFLFVPV